MALPPPPTASTSRPHRRIRLGRLLAARAEARTRTRWTGRMRARRTRARRHAPPPPSTRMPLWRSPWSATRHSDALGARTWRPRGARQRHRRRQRLCGSGPAPTDSKGPEPALPRPALSPPGPAGSDLPAGHREAWHRRGSIRSMEVLSRSVGRVGRVAGHKVRYGCIKFVIGPCKC